MSIIVITGANRGIGLELTKRFAERGETVFAGARKPTDATALAELKKQHGDKLTILTIDINNLETVRAAVKQIGAAAGRVDILINNAGIFPQGPEAGTLGSLREEPLLRALGTNTVGTLLTAQEFIPLLEKGTNARVVNISSQLGSIENARNGGYYAYNISKAAENMAMRLFAWDVKGKNIASIVLHPGWVRTDMGGQQAPLSVEESGGGIVKVVDSLTMEKTALFFDWQGNPMPW